MHSLHLVRTLPLAVILNIFNLRFISWIIWVSSIYSSDSKSPLNSSCLLLISSSLSVIVLNSSMLAFLVSESSDSSEFVLLSDIPDILESKRR